MFRGLVLVIIALFFLSWFLPWWSADVLVLGEDTVVIRPWGLENNMDEEMAAIIKGSEMPAYFAPLMWAYLGLSIALLVLGAFIKLKEIKLGKFKLTLSQLLIGGVGVSYIVVVALAVIIASIRTGDYWDLKLIGYTYIDLGEPAVTGVEAGLLPGYWLACLVGPLLIGLALLRTKIVKTDQ